MLHCTACHCMLLCTVPCMLLFFFFFLLLLTVTLHDAMQIVGQTVSAMQVLLDRLSALQMMLLQKPVVSGHYTSAPYFYLLQPIDQDVRNVMVSVGRLGALTAELLSERCSEGSLKAVQGEIAQLEQLR